MVNSHEGPQTEAEQIEGLLRRNLNGIILSRVSDESSILREFKSRSIPVVVIDCVLDDEQIPSVALDNYKAGHLAAKHLLSLGHRRVA